MQLKVRTMQEHHIQRLIHQVHTWCQASAKCCIFTAPLQRNCYWPCTQQSSYFISNLCVDVYSQKKHRCIRSSVSLLFFRQGQLPFAPGPLPLRPFLKRTSQQSKQKPHNNCPLIIFNLFCKLNAMICTSLMTHARQQKVQIYL